MLTQTPPISCVFVWRSVYTGADSAGVCVRACVCVRVCVDEAGVYFEGCPIWPSDDTGVVFVLDLNVLRD